MAQLKDLIVNGVSRFIGKVYGSFVGDLTGNVTGNVSGSSSSCTGNAATATKATQDESGNNIKAGYASSISISDHTITLKNKNGSSLGTVTVPDNNTTYSVATTSANGLMSSSDKSKLDGIASGANNYSHPTTSGNKHIPSGGSSGQILRWSADGTATWGSDNNTTYSAATQSAQGLMSAADKTKLDGIATGATAVTSSTVSGWGFKTTDNDTKNTAGSTDTSSKLFLIGATSQAANPQTYSQDTAYVGTDGCLYSGGVKVLTSHQDISGKANATEAGYSLSVSGTSVSLKNKAGTVLSTITTQDTNTTYSAATTSAAGLMSAADKTKLNGIATGANNYSLPTASASTLGGVKVGTNLSISNGVLSATDTTYSTATTSANGLMSSTDKSKLDGIASGANNYSHPTTTAKTAAAVKVGNDAAGHVVIGDALTKSDLGLGNVENKSSATIRGELTKANVTTALGYTPPTTNTTYSNFVKSGSGAAAGLVPAPPTTAGTTKYLREDGTWQVPSGGSGATKLYMHTVCFAFDVDGDEVDYNISVLSSSSQRLFSLSGSTVTITAIPGCVPFTIEGRYVTKAGGIAYIYVSGSTKKLFYSLGSAGTFLNVTLSTMNESTDEIIENIYEI